LLHIICFILILVNLFILISSKIQNLSIIRINANSYFIAVITNIIIFILNLFILATFFCYAEKNFCLN
jgi:hypothetical protein